MSCYSSRGSKNTLFLHRKTKELNCCGVLCEEERVPVLMRKTLCHHSPGLQGQAAEQQAQTHWQQCAHGGAATGWEEASLIKTVQMCQHFLFFFSSNLSIEQPSKTTNWPVETCDLDNIVKSGQLHSLHPPRSLVTFTQEREEKKKTPNIQKRSRRETRRDFGLGASAAPSFKEWLREEEKRKEERRIIACPTQQANL